MIILIGLIIAVYAICRLLQGPLDVHTIAGDCSPFSVVISVLGVAAIGGLALVLMMGDPEINQLFREMARR